MYVLKHFLKVWIILLGLLCTSQAQVWSFSPCEEKTYNLRPNLTFWPVHTPGFSESQLRLKVVGIGFKGFIEVCSLLQFGRCLRKCAEFLKILWREFPKLRTFCVCVVIFLSQAEKSLLDVGEILVGSCKPLEVLLVNKSPCSVTFSLSVQQSPVDEDSEAESSGTPLF